MKKIVVLLSVVCFLSVTSLSHATEIVRVPLSQAEKYSLLKGEEAAAKAVDFSEITAGKEDTMVTVLAVVGLLAVLGAMYAYNNKEETP